MKSIKWSYRLDSAPFLSMERVSSMQRNEKLIDKVCFEELCKKACDNLKAERFRAKNEEIVLFAKCCEYTSSLEKNLC